MAMVVSTYLDEIELARHLRSSPEEAFEVIAQLADDFSNSSEAAAWMRKTAGANTGADFHGSVGDWLIEWGKNINAASAEAG